MAQKTLQRAFPCILLVLLVLLFIAWLAFPVTIITGDIGRHIMDGKVFFTHPDQWGALLYTNFYSASNPDFLIINHHWAAGLLLYLIHALFGWGGLHIVAILLRCAALLLILDVARKISSNFIAAGVAILLLPMLAYRHEIRPEIFAYLFGAITLWILFSVHAGNKSRRLLWGIPVLSLLWVNVHASFPLGLGMIALFSADAFLKKSPDRNRYGVILCASLFATLLNPAGISGALYPVWILRDPGYAVLENLSLPFLRSIGITNPAFTLLFLSSVAFVFAIALLAYHGKLREYRPLAVLGVLLILMSFLAVRHIAFCALLLIPLFAASVFHGLNRFPKKILTTLGVLVLVVNVIWQMSLLRNRWIVLGLEPSANAAAAFIKEQKIEGPLFNNFDIGGYVIYHFFPDLRPFVYNRPESHPSEFWRSTYIPMMQDDFVWHQKLQEYGFNIIVLYHGDRTTWAQQFLMARIGDPMWAAVFVDRSVIVFVRRNDANATLISEFAIPPSSLR